MADGIVIGVEPHSSFIPAKAGGRGSLKRRGVAPSSAAALRVMIVSDIRFLSEGLVHALARAPELDVTGTARDLTEGITLASEIAPDIILIESALPDGPSVAQALRQHAPLARVVALGVIELAAEIIPWATAGVCGYVPRSASISEVVATLRQIVRADEEGTTQVVSGLLQWIADTRASKISAAPMAQALTSREQEVAALIDAGLSNKEIARELNIGIATIKSHVHNLLGKLELVRRTQVTGRLRNRGKSGRAADGGGPEHFRAD